MTTILHPDRWNPCRPDQLIKLGVVVHDSESGDGSSANLVKALQSPGDRPNGDGTFYGAGYHAVTDGLGGYIRVADPNCGPFSAPPVNYTWAHCCMPGIAAQTRDEWLDPLSSAHILGMAHFIVDQWLLDGESWPLILRGSAELLGGAGGYTSHNNVSFAWHKSTHTDPGPNFPWDVLAAHIKELTLPPPVVDPTPIPIPEEDDMNTTRLVRFSGYINVFLVGGGGPPMTVGGTDYDYLVALNLPKVFLNHPQEQSNILKQAGMVIGDLTAGGPTDRF